MKTGIFIIAITYTLVIWFPGFLMAYWINRRFEDVRIIHDPVKPGKIPPEEIKRAIAVIKARKPGTSPGV